MNLLVELMELNEATKMQRTLETMEAQLVELREHFSNPETESMLAEGVVDDIRSLLDRMEARLNATRKAMSLTNKMGDPEQSSRVTANANFIRGGLSKIRKFMAKQNEILDSKMATRQRDREYDHDSWR